MKIVNDIVIVGGGSAAWLSAAIISHRAPRCRVTVVDKEIGTPIGVGEGTLLSFAPILEECGCPKEEWFSRISSTYKAGALFLDWGEEGSEIWHPFFMSPKIEGRIDLQTAWSTHQHLPMKTHGVGLYDTAVLRNQVDTTIIDSYSYHVDAGKLVTYLQEKLQERPNVDFIESDVVDIERLQNNHIECLILKNGERVYADTFVDCTGFKSILKNDRKLETLEGRVFTNTALACQIQYEDIASEMRPYTRSQAVEHGWIWTIPTSERMGSGLVFNRDITSNDEAIEQFVSYWGESRVDREKIRFIDWTPFYTSNPWSGNVVSVGMSSGFLEPLESTGLALIMRQAKDFANIISDGYYSDAHVSHYNNHRNLLFNDCVDFVSAHYSKTSKNGKFWDFVRDTYTPTENILMNLELLKQSVREGGVNEHKIFTGTNWTTWMGQLGYPLGKDPRIEPNYALYILNKYNETVEHFRHNWSQHHSTEIKRSMTYDKYNEGME
jgi:2-polyprenyl-6-methoxyphenol hydroxylase-like FAD-dependent oxidoreductase